MTHTGGSEILKLKISCADVAHLRGLARDLQKVIGRKNIQLRVVTINNGSERKFSDLDEFRRFIEELFGKVQRDVYRIDVYCDAVGHDADMLANISSGYTVGLADE